MKYELKSEKIKNCLKKQKRLLYFMIGSIVLALGFGIWAFMIENKDLGKAMTLHEAIYNNVGEGEYVEITLHDKPYSFLYMIMITDINIIFYMIKSTHM